ncbi:hypothetical protein LTR05_008114 [Lithohypha guttulata]|uniref:Uncharacterized protein n=1 Tax=Lithohypha guttulata TaxID=1690604 RepID=A0AAN7Y8P3_9EURO|nr:hypothetical protein LTR05_008114 [Lithohypha guttulata]
MPPTLASIREASSRGRKRQNADTNGEQPRRGNSSQRGNSRGRASGGRGRSRARGGGRGRGRGNSNHHNNVDFRPTKRPRLEVDDEEFSEDDSPLWNHADERDNHGGPSHSVDEMFQVSQRHVQEDDVLEQWYKDPFERFEPEGPAYDQLRQQNIYRGLRSQGYQDEEERKDERLAQLKMSSSTTTKQGRTPSLTASVHEPVADTHMSEEENFSENEAEDRDMVEDDYISSLLKEAEHIPQLFARDESTEQNADAEQRDDWTAEVVSDWKSLSYAQRIQVLKHRLRIFDMVYGTHGLKDRAEIYDINYSSCQTVLPRSEFKRLKTTDLYYETNKEHQYRRYRTQGHRLSQEITLAPGSLALENHLITLEALEADGSDREDHDDESNDDNHNDERLDGALADEAEEEDKGFEDVDFDGDSEEEIDGYQQLNSRKDRDDPIDEPKELVTLEHDQTTPHDVGVLTEDPTFGLSGVGITTTSQKGIQVYDSQLANCRRCILILEAELTRRKRQARQLSQGYELEEEPEQIASSFTALEPNELLQQLEYYRDQVATINKLEGDIIRSKLEENHFAWELPHTVRDKMMHQWPDLRVYVEIPRDSRADAERPSESRKRKESVINSEARPRLETRPQKKRARDDSEVYGDTRQQRPASKKQKITNIRQLADREQHLPAELSAGDDQDTVDLGSNHDTQGARRKKAKRLRQPRKFKVLRQDDDQDTTESSPTTVKGRSKKNKLKARVFTEAEAAMQQAMMGERDPDAGLGDYRKDEQGLWVKDA